MYIEEKKMVIAMSKTEAKAARKYGTEEYKALQDVRRDYPNFKVVTVTRQTSSKQESYKGLTYDYMKKYIELHDDENKTIMAEYMNLRGLSEEAKEALAESCSYYDMKCWFLKKFPAIAEFHKKREEALTGKAA